ncbi:MAG TPA: methyltransferase domain-containing protein [Anaerolineae bacterium]|nr:methyltransferase domain-containing protein [Anaerolineae bacterium]
MTDWRELATNYRSPDRAEYPELDGYTRDEIYEDSLGGGALYLAARMARTMRVSPGDIVLDLGCGKGATSIFLARHFGARLVAVDLWTEATFLDRKFSARGYRDRVVPLRLDATAPLPFGDGYFDAVFCMNSLSFYGGSVQFLQHLLKHLKSGGQLVVGMETLNDEFSPEERRNPPAVFSYNLPPPYDDVNVWDEDFSKMHSPAWWENLFRESGLLRVETCFELQDAEVLYEDLVKYQIAHDLDPDDVQISIQQIEYGRLHRPAKTLFVLTAVKL